MSQRPLTSASSPTKTNEKPSENHGPWHTLHKEMLLACQQDADWRDFIAWCDDQTLAICSEQLTTETNGSNNNNQQLALTIRSFAWEQRERLLIA